MTLTIKAYVTFYSPRFSINQLMVSCLTNMFFTYTSSCLTYLDSKHIRDEDIARYSILKGNEQLFASKYKLYLPSEEVLLAEIKHQKELFLLSHPDKQDEDEEDE